ncbi:MAG: lamin tail domain-containing protein, partial [Verrucomicrobia bacterium]|nr:lamin tail domain-containing protein [Verrucomicrobiota bacterium]
QTGVAVDQVLYGAQVQGVSQGRLPNGSATIVSFAGTASPGASNYLANYTGPVLNEVLARNQSAVVSPWGDFSDFVEIGNSSASAYDLSGMSLSTDAFTPGVFVFPPGTIMAASSYLAVWWESARPVSTVAGGALNSGLTLDGNSGGVYLFNALGQLVNFVEYGFQVPNLSMGLSAGGWKLLATPTPGATNSSPAALGAASQLRFNEWMAAPLSGNDWFELYNLDPLPVDLSGMYLTDDPSILGQTNTPVAPLSFIGGKSWTLWQADNHLGDGRNHVNFALDEQGEMLVLYDANLTLMDAVSFGQQSPGVSQGRLPDLRRRPARSRATICRCRRWCLTKCSRTRVMGSRRPSNCSTPPATR